MSCHSLFFLRKITNLAFVHLFLYIHMEDTTYFPLCLEIISYTSFPIINCYSLIIASFIAIFFHLELSLIPMVVFILWGGSTALWSSFFCHGVSDPGSFWFMFIELSSLVLRNKSHPSFLLGGCTWPFLQFKCTSCMVRNISYNKKFLCIMQLFSQYNMHPYLT